jgi:hypothetical protein
MLLESSCGTSLLTQEVVDGMAFYCRSSLRIAEVQIPNSRGDRRMPQQALHFGQMHACFNQV